MFLSSFSCATRQTCFVFSCCCSFNGVSFVYPSCLFVCENFVVVALKSCKHTTGLHPLHGEVFQCAPLSPWGDRVTKEIPRAKWYFPRTRRLHLMHARIPVSTFLKFPVLIASLESRGKKSVLFLICFLLFFLSPAFEPAARCLGATGESHQRRHGRLGVHWRRFSPNLKKTTSICAMIKCVHHSLFSINPNNESGRLSYSGFCYCVYLHLVAVWGSMTT